jgi:hypothetical protein
VGKCHDKLDGSMSYKYIWHVHSQTILCNRYVKALIFFGFDLNFEGEWCFEVIRGSKSRFEGEDNL